jgi:hypothetical protein
MLWVGSTSAGGVPPMLFMAHYLFTATAALAAYLLLDSLPRLGNGVRTAWNRAGSGKRTWPRVLASLRLLEGREGDPHLAGRLDGYCFVGRIAAT